MVSLPLRAPKSLLHSFSPFSSPLFLAAAAVFQRFQIPAENREGGFGCGERYRSLRVDGGPWCWGGRSMKSDIEQQPCSLGAAASPGELHAGSRTHGCEGPAAPPPSAAARL